MYNTHILVIDDSQTNLLLMKQLLLRHGYNRISTLTNGKDGIEFVKNNKVDIVLLDLMMPGLDGYEVCKILKGNKKTEKVPIIIITAKSEPEEIDKVISFGADDFIKKPINQFELFSRIDHILKIKLYHKELETKNSELKRVNKLKNNFLGVVAHDLKSPLSIITGYSELMLMGKSELDVKYKDYLEKILDNAENMLGLINDLMDVALIEAGKYKLYYETIDLVLLVKECVENQNFISIRKDINIIFNSELTVLNIRVDKKRILQVMNNLLNNAIKFSNEHSIVNVNLLQRENNVLIKVSDSGIGIPKKDIKKIFEKFSRGSNISKKRIKGAGLGLSICKDIIEMHKGKISVDSEEDKGSTFTISIPLN